MYGKYKQYSNSLVQTIQLTTFPHDECIDSKALSKTYKSTALSSGRVDVKLRPKSISTCKMNR
jgi:hypothetical protein